MKHLLLGAGLLMAACNPSDKKTDTSASPATQADTPAFSMPYQLDKPDQRATLPGKLTEISGLTYFKDGKLLCVQDEEAVVYVFDTKTQSVVSEFGFGGYGDFEGIEYVDGHVYVLESNGTLYRFEPESTQIGRTKTDLPAKTEVEGLGYDPQTNRLLIAVKKSDNAKAENSVYAYDLRSKGVYRQLTVSRPALDETHIDTKSYKPSGIAVHPITGHWYILTSAGKRLVVVNRQGQIQGSQALDPALFRQPEGICFAPNGDLYIASEGNGKKGSLMTFAYQGDKAP